MLYNLSICLRVCSILLTISATLLWGSTLTSAEKQKRAVAFKNVQTLIAGTLWSQILIPVGILISELASECMDTYVEGYFVIIGSCLLLVMGIFIVSCFHTYWYFSLFRTSWLTKASSLATGFCII